MINQFKRLLQSKRDEVTNNINKYEKGYKQIIDAENSVSVMQIKLTDLVPKLK
jgi:hypothetical protein